MYCFCLFLCFMNGKFDKFGPPGMEGVSRRLETLFLSQVLWCWGWEGGGW